MSITPLGSPLVPLEYGSSATASGLTFGRGAGPASAISAGPMSPAVTSRDAPESISWRSTSAGVHTALTPVTAPPAAIAPRAMPAHGGTFGAWSASTSPGANPRAASVAATRSERATQRRVGHSGAAGPVDERDALTVPRRRRGDQLVERGPADLDRLVVARPHHDVLLV